MKVSFIFYENIQHLTSKSNTLETTRNTSKRKTRDISLNATKKKYQSKSEWEEGESSSTRGKRKKNRNIAQENKLLWSLKEVPVEIF